MKVFLNIAGTETFDEIQMSRNDAQILNKSDIININSKSYMIKRKILYFYNSGGNLAIDYITFVVKSI